MPEHADSTTRFSNRVEDYIRYRPGYPPGIVPFLVSVTGLTGGSTVADIGSGTGILTGLFLRKDYNVYGVEPNEAMRSAAERLLKDYPQFTSIHGQAEHTGLAPSSIDLIIAGQSFHWFNPSETKTEFKRIAKPGSFAALIWNERKEDSPFQALYDDIIRRYASDYSAVNHKNIHARDLISFFAPEKMGLEKFTNAQQLDLDGIIGRLLSSSYMPTRDHPSFEKMAAEVTALYGRYAKEQGVTLEYDTLVYYGIIRPR